MTLDDGSEERITPTSLLLTQAPDASAAAVLEFFSGWEEWVTGVLETHTTFPMLRLFRSQHEGQHWLTALGLITDAALHAQIIVGTRNKSPYWLARRSIVLFQSLTEGVDLSAYREELDDSYREDGQSRTNFADLYQQLEDHGFELLPFDQARAETLELRRLFDAQMEYLIDTLLAPRGFWGHKIGYKIIP